MRRRSSPRTLSATLSAAVLALAFGGAGPAVSEGVRLADDRAVFAYVAASRPTRIMAVAATLDRLRDPGRAGKIARSLQTLETWRDELTGFCAERGVNPFLAAAVITAESNGEVSAESPVGAAGLMQLMPATAAGLSVADRGRAVDNLYGGCRYLGDMLAKFGGDELLALAAYNAGPGAVDRYDGVPPYAETEAYIVRVARAWPERIEADESAGDDAPHAPRSSIEFRLAPAD